MENSSNYDPFYLDESAFNRRRHNNKNDDENVSFLNQNVDLVDSIMFPEGYENFMLAIYFLTVPYITGIIGLLFIFFYIGKGDTTTFLALNDDYPFLVAWAIGYEMLAAIILLWIAKLWLASLFWVDEYNKSKKFNIP